MDVPLNVVIARTEEARGAKRAQARLATNFGSEEAQSGNWRLDDRDASGSIEICSC